MATAPDRPPSFDITECWSSHHYDWDANRPMPTAVERRQPGYSPLNASASRSGWQPQLQVLPASAAHRAPPTCRGAIRRTQRPGCCWELASETTSFWPDPGAPKPKDKFCQRRAAMPHTHPVAAARVSGRPRGDQAEASLDTPGCWLQITRQEGRQVNFLMKGGGHSFAQGRSSWNKCLSELKQLSLRPHGRNCASGWVTALSSLG